MRIFGSDKVFFACSVRGPGLSEKWEAAVPFAQLQNDYIAQPLSNYSFQAQGAIHWSDDSKRVVFLLRDVEVAAVLRTQHPSSFRRLQVRCRKGDENTYWVFTKTVRLKRYGRKRLVIVHEQAELSDPPRFLLTDALHWDGARIIRVWSYRWPVEIFHEFCKQVVGLEAAQVRKEEAVKRHFRLSCVAQSLLQRIPSGGRKSERFTFAANHQQTIGQKLYTLQRDALGQWLQLVHGLFAQAHPCEHVLERLMPA